MAVRDLGRIEPAPRRRPLRPIVRRFKRLVLPRTLFGRSLLSVLLPLAVIQALLAYVFYDRHWEQVTDWLGQGFVGEVGTLVELLEQASGPNDKEAVLRSFRRQLGFVAWLDPDTELPQVTPVDGSHNRVDDKLRQLLEQALDHPFVLDAKPERNKRIAVHILLDDGLLNVVTWRKRVDSTTTTVFMLWMIGLSFGMAAIALLLLRQQLRPIRRLAIAADSFGKGRDRGDFRISGASEIRRAGAAFNRMRRRILRFVGQRTEMLAGVSHDLRTPLTRMKLALAMRPPGDELAAEIEADVLEMERMVEAYLAFVRGEGREAVVDTDLAALLAEICERGRRDGARVELEGPTRLIVPLRQLAVRRCVANLIDNAVRHAERVEVQLLIDGDHAEIVIDDDGPGIPAEQREAVFRAFFRLNADPALDDRTTGLGLTIARDLAIGHGGELELDDSPLGGLRAVIRLPL